MIYGDARGEQGPSPSIPSSFSAAAQLALTRGNTLVNGLGGANGFGEANIGRQDDSPSVAVNVTSSSVRPG